MPRQSLFEEAGISTWQVIEYRKSKRTREVTCCGGSVDVQSEYKHVVMRIGRDFMVWDEHVHRSDCAFYVHYRER